MKNVVGGYQTHAVNFFASLSKLCDTYQTHIDNECHPSKILDVKADANILLTFPDFFDNFQNIKYGKKIGYTVVENTNLTNVIPQIPNDLDALWTASNFCKELLIKNGYAKPITIIPEGVDPKVFNPQTTPNEILKNNNNFKFLSIGRAFDPRKNISALTQAFLEEFKNDDAILVLCAMAGSQSSHPKIVNVSITQLHTQIASIYTACDCYVQPTKAEGWGLPIPEAMACGLPVIATNYSAITEYTSPSTAYLIDYELAPNNLNGYWAEPSIPHLKKLMRHVFENRTEAKNKGQAASRYILSNYTWDMAAQKAYQELQSII